jgi:hypothetical protein
MGPQGATAILPLGYLEHLASGGRDEVLAAVLSELSPIQKLLLDKHRRLRTIRSHL